MKSRRYSGWMAVLVAVGLLAPAVARAAEHKLIQPEAPKKAVPPAMDVKVAGTVEVTKDTAGKVTSVELRAEDGTVYKCGPMNEWPVLEQSADKTVICLGTESTTKDGTHRLHIRSVQPQQPGS